MTRLRRYFPKGQAHGVQGLADENEYLLVFDEGDFDATGTTFNVPDWLAHTPKHILARNFGKPLGARREITADEVVFRRQRIRLR